MVLQIRYNHSSAWRKPKVHVYLKT
ncbi:uncharacterized protein METZ01_LOCUS511926, partial [marine metagenome]